MKLASRFEDLGGSEIRAIVDRAQELEKGGVRVAHFEIGRPDFDTPTVAKVATKKALDEGKVHYGPNAGFGPLRVAITNHLNERYRTSLNAEQLLVTNGAVEAVFLSLLAVVDPGTEVLIPEPSWPYYPSMVRLMGAVPRLIPSSFDSTYSPSLEALRQSVNRHTRALLLNSPNNPTGAVLDPASRAQLAEFAQEHDLLVVADEVYDRIRFGGPAGSIVNLPGMSERTALIGAFSKTYSMTGWRVGYVALPPALFRPALLAHTYINTSINTFVQYGALAALEQAEPDVELMLLEYQKRRDVALARLQAMPGVQCATTHGGFFVFPRLIDYPDDRQLAHRLLEEAYVATVPGSSFGPSGASHLRISFSCDMDSLINGLDQMEAWLRAQ